jgi:hypothetical protein
MFSDGELGDDLLQFAGHSGTALTTSRDRNRPIASAMIWNAITDELGDLHQALRVHLLRLACIDDIPSMPVTPTSAATSAPTAITIRSFILIGRFATQPTSPFAERLSPPVTRFPCTACVIALSVLSARRGLPPGSPALTSAAR